jgi:26S proteasome regulatory subunit N10
MRNGDYVPTRFEAQTDAVALICSVKAQTNPENTVAIMTMADKREVLVSLTQDVGKILSALQNIKIGGKSDILSAMLVAQVNNRLFYPL